VKDHWEIRHGVDEGWRYSVVSSEQAGSGDGDIFVISDLHIGDGGRRDNFEAGRKTPQLRAFLDHVGSERGELFILGDLFELWQMNLSLMITRRLELLDHLARLKATFVPGNHDVDLAHFVGTDFLNHPFFRHMRAPFVREFGGRRFRFFHGHETDPFNSGDDPSFGRMLSIFGGVFEDQNGSPLLRTGEGVEDVLEQFGESMLLIWQCAMATMQTHTGQERGHVPQTALTPAQNPGRLGEHINGVRADLERSHYDVAVLGHTHKPGRIGDWYFNSGSWAGPGNPFLRISPDGHVRYLDWKDGRAVEQAVPVVVGEATSGDAKPAASPRPFKAAVSAAKKFFPKPLKVEPNRLILLAQGLLALGIGIATLTVSIGQGSTAGWSVLVTAFGAYALLDGVLSLLGSSGERPVKRILSRLRGIASLLLALVVFRRGYVAEIFVVLVGISAFLSGALRVAASVMFRTVVDSRWLLMVGVGSMLVGLVILLFPTTGPLVKYALSLYLLYYGLGEAIAAVFGTRGAGTTESLGAPLPAPH
jgi:UDP-2,3-diacylglucosamine pyrophosphatase LpxH/uncharacterized membrane protein HdeD (DUF308 family)